MNKKAFINSETFANGGFWLLVGLGWSAVILGWKFSQKMDAGALPTWQIVITMIVIFFASAFFARD